MLTEYIIQKLSQAQYKILDDKTYFGEIPGLQGIWASEKTLEKASDVEIAERIVDDLFRSLTIKVLNSKIDTPVLLLLRDILQMLENSADKAEDAADAARMLSFTI